MWYFAWALGFSLAAAFAILNAMWFELTAPPEADDPSEGADT